MKQHIATELKKNVIYNILDHYVSTNLYTIYVKLRFLLMIFIIHLSCVD